MSSVHKTLENIERLNQLSDPPYPRIYQELEQVLALVRQQQSEMLRSIELRFVAPAIPEMTAANHALLTMLEQVKASARVYLDLHLVDPTWLEATAGVKDMLAQLQATAKLSMANVTYSLTVSERLFAAIDLSSLVTPLAISQSALANIQNSVSELLSSYARFAGSIQALPEITSLPASALTGATREVFATGYALDIVAARHGLPRTRESPVAELLAAAEDEVEECVVRLHALDPALALPYIGAHEALRGGNPDRVRHVLTSLRELWNHVLRRLAPDSEVLAWVPTDNKDLLHEGKPTRSARVLYVCRSLNHEPLTDFVVQDTRALVKLVEFFNHVHALEPGLTDEELRALVLRTDSWLMYILQISDGGH